MIAVEVQEGLPGILGTPSHGKHQLGESLATSLGANGLQGP